MKFCDWLRSTGHRYNGLSTRALYRIWKAGDK